MTVQTKYLIEISDIVALRCECKNQECQTTLLITLASTATNEVFRACPKCKSPWAKFGDSTFELEIRKFIDAMDSMGKIAKNLGFSLTLEIKGLLPSSSHGPAA